MYLFNKIKNHLIHYLISHTYIDSKVCYDIVKKVSREEMNVYYDCYEREEIKK